MPAVTTTSQTQDVDEFGKPKKQLPYVQNNQLLPAVAPAPVPANPTQGDLQAGSNKVMGTAQNMAIQKASQPSKTMGLVESQTNKLLEAPELIPQKYIQNQVGQYDRNRADQMKAFQETNADTSNTGATRESAYNFAMQGAQGRTDLQNKLDFESATANRSALLDALNLGQNTAKTASGLDTENFNRLINARGAFEGERAQTAEFGQAEKILGLTQNFTGDQNELDRQLQREVEGGRITQQEKDRAMDEWKTKFTTASTEKMQEKELSQAASQFTSKQDFDKWAIEQNLGNEEAQRLWQSAENDKKLALV